MAVVAEPTELARTAPRRPRQESLGTRIKNYLPRGNLLSDADWKRRHALLQAFLLLHLPALILFGLWMRHSPTMVLLTVAPIPVFRLLGALPAKRRLASFFTTAGILYCSAALVVFANGAIEAHFHFFIVIGFIALYQDWVPFGWDIAFTVLSHGIGSALKPDLMFSTMAGMDHPWRWSIIHGVSVLAACVGVILFWRTSEDEQQKARNLTAELSQAELDRRQFTSDLLVNLARRNQSMLYRQLDIINSLEQTETDPDVLSGLFRLDHLATRIRRNAENLLVLSGEEPPRVWGKPVPLTDVVRAAIAETEDLSRVTHTIDARLALVGQAVIDLTHLLAELIENAVRSSPPESQVTVRTLPDLQSPGRVMLTIEDWGVGMPAAELATANEILAQPRDVDALGSTRLGLHVVARLANRYSIKVVLTLTPGSGVTAVVLLPPELFTSSDHLRPRTGSGSLPIQPAPAEREPQPASEVEGTPDTRPALDAEWTPEPDQTPNSQRTTDREPGGLPTRELGALPTREPGALPTRELGALPTREPGATDGAVFAVPAVSAAETASTPATPEAPGPPIEPATAIKAAAPAEPDAATSPPTSEITITLTRRRPQTHLAPELQREHRPNAPGESTATPSAPSEDAIRAREALSRYQASRQAALADDVAENESSERNRS